MESRADNRLLNFPKVRGAQTEPISVFLDGSTGRYKMISGGDDAKTKNLGDRILAFLQKSPYNRYEQDEISEALGIPLVNRDSVYQALGRLFKRGLITKRPSKNGGKRKVYGVANPSQLAHAEGLRSATVTQDNKSQDTHPPLSAKVSVKNAEIVAVQQVELTDSLTDTSNNLTDTKLTPQSDVKENNPSNIDSEVISAKLTDTDTQGSVCPKSATVTQETVTPDPADRSTWTPGTKFRSVSKHPSYKKYLGKILTVKSNNQRRSVIEAEETRDGFNYWCVELANLADLDDSF
jgi:DNA-binding MarR family transcriptional regulator